jgi:hypothetical protein
MEKRNYIVHLRAGPESGVTWKAAENEPVAFEIKTKGV